MKRGGDRLVFSKVELYDQDFSFMLVTVFQLAVLTYQVAAPGLKI